MSSCRSMLPNQTYVIECSKINISSLSSFRLVSSFYKEKRIFDVVKKNFFIKLNTHHYSVFILANRMTLIRQSFISFVLLSKGSLSDRNMPLSWKGKRQKKPLLYLVRWQFLRQRQSKVLKNDNFLTWKDMRDVGTLFW